MKLAKILLILALPMVLIMGCQKMDSVQDENLTLKSAITGNGAPSGAHYTLNIIGVSKDKTALMKSKDYSEKQIGRRIFVPLEGSTKIKLTEGEYAVLDANGTDNDGALFQLPDPSDGSDPVTGTIYSVFARVLGTPGGNVTMTTCATSPLYVHADGVYEEIVCSEEYLYLERTAGKSKFVDVSRYLLTMWVDIDGPLGPIAAKRYNIFDDAMYDYFWQYDNNGVKLLQLRFYEIPSDLPVLP